MADREPIKPEDCPEPFPGHWAEASGPFTQLPSACPSRMTKIRVTPEGRDGLWLADKDSLKAWIVAQNFEAVHNFIDGGFTVIGADHEVNSVLADIDAAERVAILTGDAKRENLGHALALIIGNRLGMYDVGDVTEADMEPAS